MKQGRNSKKRFKPGSISVFWNIMFNIITGTFAFMCIFPFVFVIIISFTDEMSLALNGYKLIPQKLSLNSYAYLLKAGDQLARSYMVSIFITIVGTIITLVITASYAYVIYKKDFKYRKHFTFIAFFTMLFNGGLVPFYMVMTQILHMRDKVWALILPLCLNAFYIIVLRTFFQINIPDSILESAEIDGSREYRIFFQIVLPISLPGLAVIGLFSSLGYWNDWFNALLFIDSPNLTPLQYLLMRIEKNMEFIIQNAQKMSSGQTASVVKSMPRESAKMAIVVMSVLPIACAYPFFQKYFISGLTIGSVKG